MYADERLIEETRAGRSSAFGELADRYRNGNIGIAYHCLRNFEDAAQDAFVQAYLRLESLRDPRRFAP